VRQEAGTVEQCPQCGQLVAARVRPSIIFHHPATLICPSLYGHLDVSRIENVQPSSPPQAGILHHRDANMLVVPVDQLRCDLLRSRLSISCIHGLLDGSA